MALLSDYASGTITVAADGTAVTGSGTAWSAAGFTEGDLLIANGYFGIVGSVESNTALTLAQPWRGGALTAAAYRLRYQGDGSRISAQARQLTELLGTSGNLEALADISGAANSLPYFVGVGQIALTTLTPFARTLLDDLNGSTALSTLGVSDFMKTLLDDANQAAALATLGAASSADLAGKYPNASGVANAAAIADLTTAVAGKYPNASGVANETAIAANAAAIATNAAAISANTTAISANAAAIAQLRKQNKIINPDFLICQRGTSQTTSGYGSTDRWLHQNSGSSKTTSVQAFTVGQTAVPGEPVQFCRTAVTSVAGASNFAVMSQNIESVRTLAGKTATVTFYAKADAARNIAVELSQNFGTGGSPSASVTAAAVRVVALTTAWTKYSFTVAIPSISGKTIGTTNDGYLGLAFWFDAGTSFAARAGSIGQQSGTFDIAHVSLVEGDSTAEADPLQARSIGEEVRLCERYYQNYPGTFFAFSGSAAAGVRRAHIFYRTKMRAVPTLSWTSSATFVTTEVTTTSATWYTDPSNTTEERSIGAVIADAEL